MKLDAIGVLFANSWKRFQERYAVAIEIFIVPLALLLISQLLLAHKAGPALALGSISIL